VCNQGLGTLRVVSQLEPGKAFRVENGDGKKGTSDTPAASKGGGKKRRWTSRQAGNKTLPANARKEGLIPYRVISGRNLPHSKGSVIKPNANLAVIGGKGLHCEAKGERARLAGKKERGWRISKIKASEKLPCFKCRQKKGHAPPSRIRGKSRKKIPLIAAPTKEGGTAGKRLPFEVGTF